MVDFGTKRLRMTTQYEFTIKTPQRFSLEQSLSISYDPPFPELFFAV